MGSPLQKSIQQRIEGSYTTRERNEYAKREAICFGVWLHSNWQNILNHGWILQIDAMKSSDFDEMMKGLVPIEEVYELYLKSKQKP